MNYSLKINRLKSVAVVCLSALVLFSIRPALAEGICDYKPSSFISGAITAGTGATAAAGAGLKGAGFYTLTHGVTGATMLGSTAGGVSAAGTAGILGGTAGVIGSVAAVLMSPVTIGVGVVIGVGASATEAYCYFSN